MSLKLTFLGSSIAVFLASTIAFAQTCHMGSDLPIIGDNAAAGALIKAGHDAVAAGRLDIAEDDYRKALTFCPFDEEASLDLARCAVQQGDFATALTYYRKAINEHGEQDNVFLLIEYVPVLNEAGDGQDSVSWYDHVVDLCKKGIGVTPLEIVPQTFRPDGSDYVPMKLEAMSHLLKALNASTSDDKRISTEMQAAMSLDPNDSINYFYQGVFLSRAKKSGVKEAFQRALALDRGANAKIINQWIARTK